MGGEGTQIEHGVEGRAETSRKPRCLGFVGQNIREEKAACKEESHLEGKFRGFASSLWRACEKTARGSEKNCQK